MVQRYDTVKQLRELVVRARSGFKVIYGPDFSRYEQVDGTRACKPSSRKLKAKTA